MIDFSGICVDSVLMGLVCGAYFGHVIRYHHTLFLESIKKTR